MTVIPSALIERYGLSEGEVRALSLFDDELTETASHTNLVARSTLPERWTRHYADSLQLFGLVPKDAGSLLDVGSGGGFPGVPLAILAAHRHADLRLTLCESVGKKASFLRSVTDRLELANTTVAHDRAERLPARFDVVTARAVSSLVSLLDLCVPRLKPSGTLILPKGRGAEAELAEAKKRWRMTAERVDSHTDPDATILVITKPERRS